MPSQCVPAELLKGKHSSSLQLEDILFNSPRALAATPGEGSGAAGAADGPSGSHHPPASSNGVMQGEGQPGAHARPVSHALDPAVIDTRDHRTSGSARRQKGEQDLPAVGEQELQLTLLEAGSPTAAKNRVMQKGPSDLWRELHSFEVWQGQPFAVAAPT